MQKFLIEFTTYNQLANARVGAVLQKLTPEQWNLDQKSSYNTIRKTAEHIADCEYNWLKRIRGNSTWEFKAKTYEASNELMEFWLHQSQAFIKLAEQSDDKKLTEIMLYKNIKGDSFSNELYKTIAHVMNHSTYHRGQLITMLRGAGVTEIPNTDLIAFYRI